MPAKFLKAYVAMRPRLEAEEALARISQTAAGAGTMEEKAQRSYRDQLSLTANGGRRNVKKATAASARALGIKVVTE